MQRNLALAALALTALMAVAVSGEVFFEENFDAGWEDRWVKSTFKAGDEGAWGNTAGKYYGDPDNKGLQTTTDYRWYDISAKTKDFNNKGKTLVLQYTVKHEQNLDCGGGYIKLAPKGVDQSKFGGDSDYSIMFGPDICGYSTKRVHVIFTYKGKNHLIKREIKPETDEKTHIYTLIVKPDNTYEVQIDLKKVQSGSLYDDWDMLQPKIIKDPKAFKPEDWDEREEIDDPNDKKPDGYDEIPKEIVDPDASKPEDWDDDSDGEWEAPTIDNPEYKGEWKAKRIPNPAYKGKWVAPDIDNPDFVDDAELYHVVKDNSLVGFELWQVKAGTIFDNILVCDDPEYAKAQAEKTIVPFQKGEAEMKESADKAEAEMRKAQEEAAKAKEAAGDDDDDDDDEDDDEDDKAKKEL
uniref:Calreticulin n=2 Tax=Hemiselmis andersenii TaxID=464988 RepID=A0A6T8LDM7_HEMAN|mmetsp:Transcript_32267/g.75390  ORF Transcript_32267/g.75390 Transcript_32267/m.75390 type:complete len:408 (+) Transcript_32267:40-1263(+)